MSKSDKTKYKDDYGYEVTSYGIRIKAPKLFELFLMIGNGDTTSMKHLVRMMIPLFREIPCGEDIIHIALLLNSEDISHILNEVKKIIHIMAMKFYITILESQHKEMAVEEIKKQIQIFEKLEEPVSKWIQGITMLMTKNKDKKLEDYIKSFASMAKAFNEFYKEIPEEERPLKNLDQQVDLILTIMGLVRGEFEYVEHFANTIGCFDKTKVKGLLNILLKYRENIFSGGISGLMQNINMNNAKGLLNKGMDELKNQSMKAVDGAMDAASDAAGSAMKSMGFDSAFGMFSSLFEQFDKDDSGFINYEEFVDLCKYMGLTLDKEQSLKLFAKADMGGNNQIEMREFQFAVILIKLEIAHETLLKLGVTTEDLLIYAVMLLLFLALLLIFVFFGIFAFSKSEGFNAVINSLLPLAAGGAAAARGIDLQGIIKGVTDYIKKFFSSLDFQDSEPAVE